MQGHFPYSFISILLKKYFRIKVEYNRNAIDWPQEANRTNLSTMRKKHFLSFPCDFPEMVPILRAISSLSGNDRWVQFPTASLLKMYAFI